MSNPSDFSLLLGPDVPSRFFSAGEVIFREGDQAQEFFVIRRGEVEIRSGNRLLETLYENEIFGEMALIDSAAKRRRDRQDRRDRRADLGEAIYLPREAHAPFRAQGPAGSGAPAESPEQGGLSAKAVSYAFGGAKAATKSARPRSATIQGWRRSSPLTRCGLACPRGCRACSATASTAVRRLARRRSAAAWRAPTLPSPVGARTPLPRSGPPRSTAPQAAAPHAVGYRPHKRPGHGGRQNRDLLSCFPQSLVMAGVCRSFRRFSPASSPT